jgi:hypothetical protein
MEDEREIATGTLDHCAAVLMRDETATVSTLANGVAIRSCWLGELRPNTQAEMAEAVEAERDLGDDDVAFLRELGRNGGADETGDA